MNILKGRFRQDVAALRCRHFTTCNGKMGELGAAPDGGEIEEIGKLAAEPIAYKGLYNNQQNRG